MQGKHCEKAKDISFREFLSSQRTRVLVILLLALTLRVVLAVRFPLAAGDETRYTVPAVNMLAGHGFSSDVSAPYLPTEHAVPLYPIFVAAVYSIFGERNLAVRIAQSVLDLLTCVLVAFVAFNLAPNSLRKIAAISALLIYGCLSWFTVNWTRYILSETLVLFLTSLAVAVSILALRRNRWLWPAVGAICGLALLTRADSVLLVFAFVLFLVLQIARQRSSASLANLFMFCLAIPLVLAPWIIRNYVALDKFQPLASEYGFARGGYMPKGYLWWIRTWMTDETYFNVFSPAFAPGDRSFDPRALPQSIFDSAEEREQVLQVLDRYNQTGRFTSEMNEQFQSIANQRIKRAPLRFFFWLPIRRSASVWLTGFATHDRFHRFLRILSVLPILIGGTLGFALWARGERLAELLILVILIRTLFLAYHYAPEARYIVEAYPSMIAACGITAAALCLRLQRAFGAKLRTD
jgi:4-amino-4-deoxy-L-arabinose transferase-like glycosyltransferase